MAIISQALRTGWTAFRNFGTYTIGDAFGARSSTGVLLNKKTQVPIILAYTFGYFAITQWKWLRSPDDAINLLHKLKNCVTSGLDLNELRDETYFRHAAEDREFGRLGGLRNEARNIFHGLFLLGGGTLMYHEYGKWLEKPTQINNQWKGWWRMPKAPPYPARIPPVKGVAWTAVLIGIMGISYFFSSMAGNADARELQPGTTAWHPANFRPSEDFCASLFTSDVGIRCFAAPLWSRAGNMTMRGSNYLYYGIGCWMKRSNKPWAGFGQLLFNTKGVRTPDEVRSKVRRFNKAEQMAITNARDGVNPGSLFWKGMLAVAAVYLVYEGYRAIRRLHEEKSENPVADGFWIAGGMLAATASLAVALRVASVANSINAFSLVLNYFVTPARLGYLVVMTAVGGTLSGTIGVTTRLAQGFDNTRHYLTKQFGLGYVRPWPNRVAITTWSSLTDLPMTQAHGFFWGQASVYQPAEAMLQRRQAIKQKYLELAQKYRLAETEEEEQHYARRLAEKERSRGALSEEAKITLEALQSNYDDPDEPDAQDIQMIKQTLHIPNSFS